MYIMKISGNIRNYPQFMLETSMIRLLTFVVGCACCSGSIGVRKGKPFPEKTGSLFLSHIKLGILFQQREQVLCSGNSSKTTQIISGSLLVLTGAKDQVFFLQTPPYCGISLPHSKIMQLFHKDLSYNLKQEIWFYNFQLFLINEQSMYILNIYTQNWNVS